METQSVCYHKYCTLDKWFNKCVRDKAINFLYNCNGTWQCFHILRLLCLKWNAKIPETVSSFPEIFSKLLDAALIHRPIQKQCKLTKSARENIPSNFKVINGFFKFPEFPKFREIIAPPESFLKSSYICQSSFKWKHCNMVRYSINTAVVYTATALNKARNDQWQRQRKTILPTVFEEICLGSENTHCSFNEATMRIFFSITWGYVTSLVSVLLNQKCTVSSIKMWQPPYTQCLLT